MEVLVEALAELASTPLASPFAKETILVPSKPLAAHVSLHLAAPLSVFANPDFHTPRAWLDRLTRPSATPDPFHPEALAWSIAAVLPAHLDASAFADLRRYLADDHDATKRLALAARIAQVFDRYVLYRPELVAAWQAGQDDHWQARLFRALVEKHGATHLAARVDALVEALRAGDGSSAPPMPERISLFHVGPLSPVERRAFEAIATRCEVHVFELRTTDTASTSLYVAPGDATMLAALQQAELAPTVKRRVSPGDASVSVHACHSPMRECEVLRDQVLAALAEDASLEPRDVLVLCPDLDTYAPVIDAVFGADGGRKAPRHLPYRIVDGAAGSALPVVDALVALLEAASSRMTAPEVVDLLHREPIRARFGLGEGDVETIRGWVMESGIRWGVDEAHRSEVGQPATRPNTWRFGLDRLLLGYAAGKDGDTTFAGSLPFDDVNGSAAATLGALAAFCEALFALREELSGTATIAEWQGRVGAVLERMVASRCDSEYQHQIVRSTLADLAARAEAAGFGEAVPLSVVRDAIAGEVAERGRRFALSSGEIRFASLAAGRCVPARVVALLGMNDGVFPRRPRPMGFDLMARDPRPGDPSVRDEDRRVFREAVFAARERLVITFVGRSIRNDAERPPSVVVSELLDAIDAGFVVEGDGERSDGERSDGERSASEHVLVRHALHAFSPRYFEAGGDPRVFSHAARLCDAARAMVGERVAAPSFVTGPLPAPAEDAEMRPVSIDELCAFFSHPVAAFVSRRVGVLLGKEVAPLGDREPLEVDGLDRWAIQTEVVRRARLGDGVEAPPPAIALGGKLPLGTVGEVTYEELWPDPAMMGVAVRDLLGPSAPPPVDVDVDLGDGLRLIGWLRSVGKKGQVLHRYSLLRGKTELDAWIRHLAMLASGGGRAAETHLLSRGPFGPLYMRLRPVKRPEKYLRELVDLYRLGQRVPLPLFPDPASEYVDELMLRKTPEQALAAARKKYVEGWDGIQNPYVVKVYGERDPLEPGSRLFDGPGEVEPPSFDAIARQVFGPIYEHLVQEGA